MLGGGRYVYTLEEEREREETLVSLKDPRKLMYNLARATTTKSRASSLCCVRLTAHGMQLNPDRLEGKKTFLRPPVFPPTTR